MAKSQGGPSALSLSIAADLRREIALGEIAAGSHLRAQQVADRFGVSRSPVREALIALEEQGYLANHQNRGFFVREREVEVPSGEVGADDAPFDPPNDYQRIADDWLSNQLPADITEQMLRERYDLTRAQLSEILMRAVREGWAERKQGYGWRFLPVAKTATAFEQIYRFRLQIEPAALLEPTFEHSPKTLQRLRAKQERLLDSGIEKWPGEQLLEYGSNFHEEIIKLSGNPFFYHAFVRVNRMRRLMEYRTRVDRKRLYKQCTQHLQIIEALEKGAVVEASYLMRRHLGGALEEKSPLKVFQTERDAEDDLS
jgi:DNA-binding GntR family transcriptional regulator